MIAASLSAGGHPDSNLPGRHHEDDLVVGTEDGESYRSLTARATGYRMDLESESFIVASAVSASAGHHGHSSPRGDGSDNLIADPISAHEGKTYTHEGKNNFRTHNVVEAWDDRNQAALGDTHHTLRGAGLQRSDVVNAGMGVRRLTPLECERLQGWPDEHTRWGADGKEIKDSHRYQMIGNGVVATVAEWLGHRIVAVDRWITDESR
jgi:site-specific DNA-cytosine methylase